MSVRNFASWLRLDCAIACCSLLFAASAFASWQPGLLGGSVSGTTINKIDTPISTAPYAGPHVATTTVTSVWGNNTTWVYSGQIFIDGAYAFAEQIDDGVFLRIDGVDVLDDPSRYNTVTFKTITREAGWYSFELRLFNGGSSGGPRSDGGWGTTAFGFGYNTNGVTGSSSALYEFPYDPGDMSFFRYDDGTGFADSYEISGNPQNVSVATPAFGYYQGIASNAVIALSVVSPWTNSAQNVIAVAKGCDVFEANADESAWLSAGGSATGAAYNFTHPGIKSKVVWNFAVSNRIDAAAGANGSVSAGGWCLSTEPFELTATPDNGMQFMRWEGDVPSELELVNPLPLPGDAPRSVTATFAPTYAGAVQYVTTYGNDTNSGLAFVAPKRTIQAAVDTLGASGGKVIVAPGRYGVSATIVLNEAVAVSGMSGVASDVDVHLASGTTRVFILNNADAKLEFITISDGNINTGANNELGGNIRIDSNGGTVADCIIRNGRSNSKYGCRGGNISLDSANALVTRCVIINGSSNGEGEGGGGGVYIHNGGGLVENCFIAYNSDGNGAGGSAALLYNGSLVNCTIVQNSSNKGGAVNANRGSAAVYNCVIVDNYASGVAADDVSGTAYCGAGQAPRFFNCVADAQINANNFFMPSVFGFVDTTAHDYRLTPLSPALDVGSSIAILSQTDVEGNPRESGAAIDAGCYEFQIGGALEVSFDADKTRHAVPFPVAFTAAVANASGPVMYSWDFGDGVWTAPSPDSSTSYVYETPGTFTVSVRATSGSDTASKSRQALISAAPGVICVVAGSTTEAFPYGTFATALPSITAAYAFADDGTTILVSNGTYTAVSQMTIEKAVNIVGFSGDPRDSIMRVSSIRTQVVTLNHPDAVISSMTIRDGSSYTAVYGGNVRINAKGGVVTNCVITSGKTENHHGNGGGIYMESAAGLVTHCWITNNWVGSNGADNKGGGIVITSGRLEHSLIADNRGAIDGGNNNAGGIHIRGGSVLNCTIANNESRNAGGVHATGGTLVNCVIAGNRADTNGAFDPDAAACIGSAKTTAFVNCALDTAAPVNDSCIASSSALLFANFGAGNFYPAAASPSIDAGLELTPPPATDLDGNQRVQGPAIDLGCFEADASQFNVSFECDITQAIAPTQVVFTVAVGGAEQNETIEFRWDFEGKGVFSSPTANLCVTNLYQKGGIYSVTLETRNLTSGQTLLVTQENLIKLAPRTIYVVSGNPNAAIPYDDKTNAAPDIKTAVDFAISGCKIIICDGVYTIGSTIWMNKALDIGSESGKPESVVITRDPATRNYPMIRINNPDLRLNGVTIENGSNNYTAGNLYLDVLGGAVANCVIRNGESYDHNGTAAAAHMENGLITHCVITNNVIRNSQSGGKTAIRLVNGRIENSLIANNRDDNTAAGITASIFQCNNGSIVNCTIADNVAMTSRGLFWFENNATTIITNSIIAGNATQDAIHPLWAGNAGLVNGTDRFVCSTVDADINDTCQIADASEIFENRAAANYRLAEGSPAVDAGELVSDEYALLAGVDLLGAPRIIHRRVDHGCYEQDYRGRVTVIVIR